MRRLRFAGAAVVVFGLLVPGPARADQAVGMKGSKFVPRDITVRAGDKVTWTNDDSGGHSVTADDGSFDSSPTCGTSAGTCMERGNTYTTTFATPGRYGY